MPATVLTLDQVRANILREIKNQRSDADIGPDSDHYVRASGVASVIEGLYAHQVWTAKQIFPDTADEDNLILHARLRGIERKPAVVASGTVRVTGKPGVQLASGLSAKYQDGTAYVTTSDGTFDATGNLVVSVVAVDAGVDGNRQDGDALTLTVPPVNVDATLAIVNLRGGTAIETLDSLLARLLQRIRRPSAGGNKYDYWQWAMEVAGVTAAFVYPLRRGLGTVDVVIVTEDGLPSDDVLKAVQAHIDDQRPVRAKDARVVVPSIKLYDVTAAVKLNGITLDAAQSAVESGLAAYNAIVSPGDMVIRNRIGGVINDTLGIEDYVLESPTANVVPVVDAQVIEWCRLGKVTLRTMT
ncbi:phage tail protein [Burkholderia pseudomallei]|uniref:baseplate J/gp47 family protein n=1 Tax=Burkholderia pseudomallei TaxID=28450 RepID=UPI000531529A|nr:baseplate J/gp47 family protein [Burkholderia pseudomallei]KGX76247.1 baseplate J-like family protein [Burkholderia pseudomallei MSHR435]AJX21314.1 baseplate J-like family protein [Burkholderia pseudomallei MSHR491]KGS74485.1 baseplate J-like family protein [Burkholderia pseudomallei MSHR5596]KGW87590.1 baseplate J-like family protein [Burkholderia pseudomallei MSHR456]KGW90357.1 baseplate J-like family protein [Burkholderia pseudomallei MSHR449]